MRARYDPASRSAFVERPIICSFRPWQLVCRGPLRSDPPAPKSPSDASAAPQLIGRWRVEGCATSPRDPAACASGEITFDARHWSVELPCCKRASAYFVVATSPQRITISSEGVESQLVFDASGGGRWNPGGLGGRVGELSFVRAQSR